MMAYNQAFQHPTEDLFLDILTKEEREALLNKKMEEISKKNEALRKRHEEIEADKRRAEKLSKPVGSPKKESKPLPGEEIPLRPRGRGKPQSARSPKDRPPPKSQGRGSRRRRENSQEVEGIVGRIPPERHMYSDRLTNDDEEETHDNDRFHNRRFGHGRGHSNTSGYHNQNTNTPGYQHQNTNTSGYQHQNTDTSSDQRQNTDTSGYQRKNTDTSGYQRKNTDTSGYQRQNTDTSGYQRKNTNTSGDQRPNTNTSGYQRQNSNPDQNDHHFRNQQQHEEFQNNVNQTSHSAHQYAGRLAETESGPPPDPTFNFLADRGREGQGHQESARDKSRRHPKNFGGTEFKNVTMKMKLQKDKHDRGYNGSPNSPMEMSMTGRERRQYSEWKAERERVDQDRIDRQKSNSGEWRRAWDVEKMDSGFDDDGTPHRSEPARRPGTLSDHLPPEHAMNQTGRIGSGRFVHTERLEERQRGDAPAGPRGYSSDRGKPGSVPRGRGRGRARGRGRGGGQRIRSTSSGSDDQSRKVEQKEDLLVVQFDNSPGDQSVEVEYDEINHRKKRNGDRPMTNNKSGSQERNLNQNGRNKSKRKSPPKNPTPAKHESGEEYWEDDIFADAELQVHQGSPEYGFGDLAPEIRIKEPTPIREGSGALPGYGEECTDGGSLEDNLDGENDRGDECLDDNLPVDGDVNNQAAPAPAPNRVRTKSGHSVSTGASDDWEDIPEDDEFYNMDESFGEEIEESEPSPPGKQQIQTKLNDKETTKETGEKDQIVAEIQKTVEEKTDPDFRQKDDTHPDSEKTPRAVTETPNQRENLKINVDLKTPEGQGSGEQFLSPISPFKTPTGVTKVMDWAAEMDKFGSPTASPDHSPKRSLDFQDSPAKGDSGEIKDAQSDAINKTNHDESSLTGGDKNTPKDRVSEEVSVPLDNPSINQCAGNTEQSEQTDKETAKLTAQTNDQKLPKESSETEESSGGITQPYSDPVKSEDFGNQKSVYEELQDFMRKDTRKGSLPESNQ